MMKKVDEQVDPEQQFILRLPEDVASQVHEDLSANVSKLSINLDSDFRSAQVVYDGLAIPGKLYDLPCIVESLKTTDNKSYYKTADISQILVAEHGEGKESSKRKPKKQSKVYLYPHGLTPPLKNVRKSRFRKILKKKYIESPDVENEVKALLKSDLYAVSLPRYELVDETEKEKEAHREELNRLFEEVSSEEETESNPSHSQPREQGPGSGSGQGSSTGRVGEGQSQPQPVDEQVRAIMREISHIQQRREAIKDTLATLTAASDRLPHTEELELLRIKEKTKLNYLDELRSKVVNSS